MNIYRNSISSTRIDEHLKDGYHSKKPPFAEVIISRCLKNNPISSVAIGIFTSSERLREYIEKITGESVKIDL
ncbi:MAG: hypothetical protein COW84_06930 [Gammaproteobacteria bacterium CG22_combo_CG10-13_8_21_14_all_40_8]|nr:MAG: hypothetical protein COW84_06930 [Gammaproteobacteria bacterium CG22_combo_CG10-13_8_21_14_all_40_8]